MSIFGILISLSIDKNVFNQTFCGLLYFHWEIVNLFGLNARKYKK